MGWRFKAWRMPLKTTPLVASPMCSVMLPGQSSCKVTLHLSSWPFDAVDVRVGNAVIGCPLVEIVQEGAGAQLGDQRGAEGWAVVLIVSGEIMGATGTRFEEV